LSGARGFKIAIGWQGNPAFPEDRERSFQLSEFAPIANLQGVTLISLPKGVGAEQLATLGGRFAVLDFSGGIDEQSGAFVDSAAIIHNVDLVITSDTALAYLAGAIGAPVWLALSFTPHWRWLLDRTDNPWYPTMRLFRQTSPGDWAGVFQQMRAALGERLRR
jgi:hypothetical protein